MSRGLCSTTETAEVFVSEVGRQQDDGLLGRISGNLFKSLESTDVDTTRGLSEETGSFSDGSSGGFFAFGGDDGGAAFAFGFGLLGHGAFHIGGEFDVLELDGLDIDAPFVSLSVDDGADLGGDFVALAKDFVEIKIAGDIAQGGLSEGGSGVFITGSLEDGFGGVDDARINHGVNINGNVIASDDFLLRDVHWGGADVDLDHFIDIRDNDAKTRVQNAGEFTKAQHDAAFVLIDDTNAGDNKPD